MIKDKVIFMYIYDIYENIIAKYYNLINKIIYFHTQLKLSTPKIS